MSNFRTFSAAAEKVFNTIFDVKIMDDIKYPTSELNDTPYHCLLLKYLFFVAKVRDLC